MFQNDPELDGPLPSFIGSCTAVGGDVAKTPSCQTMRSRKSEVKRVKVLFALAGYQTAFGGPITGAEKMGFPLKRLQSHCRMLKVIC